MIAAKTLYSLATSHRHCSCNEDRLCKATDSQLVLLHKIFLMQSTICKDSVVSWRVRVETVSLDIDLWWMIDHRQIQHLWPQELLLRQDDVTIETNRKLKSAAWIRPKQWILRDLPLTACCSTIRLKKVSHQVSKFKTSKFNRLTTRWIINTWMLIQKIELSKCYCFIFKVNLCFIYEFRKEQEAK